MSRKKKSMSERDKGFMQGFACALSCVIRCYDQPTIVKNVLEENGFTLENFTAPEAEVEEYDLELLKEACE